MSGTTETAREIYMTGLRNQHAVEQQAIELLERQVGRLENYPEMSQRLREHIEESRVQARRLEELMSSLGTSSSVMKDTALSIMGNMAALMHAPAPDEVLKNTMANFAFEHFEIAAYKSLLTLAEATGHGAAMTALKQSLGEEEAMAGWIDAHLSQTTLTYLRRSEAGQTAGV
ncbi:MAG TPA: ferritin-like domain-containing protein [Acetobacteraceae bacterium]